MLSRIEDAIKDAGDRKDELKRVLDTPQSRDSIRQLLVRRKTIAQLVAIAKGSGAGTETTQKEVKA